MDELKPNQAMQRLLQSRPAYINDDDTSTVAGSAMRGSTVADSEVTFDNDPQRYLLSRAGEEQGPYEDEDFVEITGLDCDHTDADKLTFFGFTSMRYRLHDRALDFLLKDRRWSNVEDSEFTVGKKNVIICFVGLASIEDCLLREGGEPPLANVEALVALTKALGILSRRGAHAHTFLKGIANAFTKSRMDEINQCLRMGHDSPPVPEHPLDKMLLDVVDRHITFLRTKEPLNRLAAPFPWHKTLKLRCSVVERLLAKPSGIDKCWSKFVPTLPTQAAWPLPWKLTAWKSKDIENTEQQGVSQPRQAQEVHHPSTVTGPTSSILPMQVDPSVSEEKYNSSKQCNLPTAHQSLGDKLPKSHPAVGTVEASFERFRYLIHPARVSMIEASEMEVRFYESRAYFLGGMNCAITKPVAGENGHVQRYKTQLDPLDLNKAFENLDKALSSVITAANNGVFSIEQTKEIRIHIDALFNEASSNLKSIACPPPGNAA